MRRWIGNFAKNLAKTSGIDLIVRVGGQST